MDERTLHQLAISCDDSFRRLFDETQASEYLNYHVSIENQWGRFTVWGRNLGAFQQSTAQSSLEHRLRNSEDVKGVVRDNLEAVEQACESAYNIVTGVHPNRSTAPIVLPEGIVPSTSELDGLIESIESAITLLFRTSMLLRQYRQRGRIPHGRPAPDPGLDIRHVKDKFPKAKETPHLADRLGTLIAERREYIQYRQEHQIRLAAVHDERLGEVAPDIEANTVATTYNADEEAPASVSSSKQLESMVRLPTLSIRTQATSFASAFGIDDDEELRVPELTDLVFNKIQLQYSEPFECPFCRTIQSVENRQEWKKHVYADLQPFSCTAQGCPSRFFTSRHEWARHEIATHRRQWRCPECPKSTFSQKAHFVQHLTSAHPDVPSDSHSLVLDTCHSPVLYFDQSACPLCQEWQPPANMENNSLDFYRHLGQHMMYLSLSAIPQVIEGLELVGRPSSDKATPTRSQVSTGSGSVNPSPVDEIALSLDPTRPQIKERTGVANKSSGMKPTWFLAPSWDFPPGGLIALGNIIQDPQRPHRPLDRIKSIPPDCIFVGTQQVDTMQTGQLPSSPFSLWVNFLQFAGVTSTRFEPNSGSTSTYKMGAIERQVLSVEALAEGALLQEVLMKDAVKGYVREGLLRSRPVFLVSGVMIAKDFSFTRESSMRYRGRTLGASLTVTGGPIEAAAAVSLQASKGSEAASEGFEAASDFVFAYQLQKIVLSRQDMGGLKRENYIKGALF